MATLFQNVLAASFHGSIVIAAVCLLRLLLKKTPKKFLCLLWMLAFARLLMPFEIQSKLSLQPEPELVILEEHWQESLPEEEIPFSTEEILWEEPIAIFQEPIQSVVEPEQSAAAVEANSEITVTVFDWKNLIPVIWLSVAGCFLLYCIVSYLHLRLRVREAIRIPGGWECDRIETAFILGFVRPKIYIPMGLPETVQKHILAHERTHLEKGDHWYKMLGYIALAVHWFNPLVWLAYALLCKDIELACDERVVQFMELEERKSYSAALLRCSTNKMHFTVCPVAFGEVSVKERIKTVLNYRKPSFWISLLGVLSIGFVAVCLLTSPMAKTAEERVAETAQEVDGRMVVQVSDVDELLAAIGSNTVIELSPGTYDFSAAENYGKTSGSRYYSWEECADGYELVLYGGENLSIRGSGKFVTVLETEPRYADVLMLRECSNVSMQDFTAGHTKQKAECGGGVIRMENCREMSMHGLGLYGCGVVGLITLDCEDVLLTGSDIYECSSSAVDLHETYAAQITGCRIYKIGDVQYGGYTFFSIGNCQNVLISDCEISDSTVMNLMYASGDHIELRNNLFLNNRTREAAWNIQSGLVVMEDNQFTNNNIRKWYDGFGNFAVDQNGKAIKEFVQQGQSEPEAEVPMLQIHVATVDELIAAIGSNREIILDSELYDLSTATGYGVSMEENYCWEDIYDGPALVIRDVQNMVIRGSNGDKTAHTISAVPRYADVLAFSACSNVTLCGFTAGHTREPGSCAGGVLEFRDCDDMTVDNCGLYGCGILGVYAEYSSNITVKNSDIYECSQGGIQIRETDGIVIENNTFRDLGGEPVNFIGCTGISMDGTAKDPYNATQREPLPVDADWENAADPEDMDNLMMTVLDFTAAYLAGKTHIMELYLAPFYTGDAAAVEDENARILDIQIPEDYPEDMESQGWCKVSVLLTRDGTDMRGMSLEMCRVQGLWKVQDYYWGNGARDALSAAVDNFVYAYFANDLEYMQSVMAETYTRPLEGYSGNSGEVVFLPYEVAEHRPNRTVEEMITYSPSIPFKETVNSDSVTYLTINLQKWREGGWKVADYGLEK